MWRGRFERTKVGAMAEGGGGKKVVAKVEDGVGEKSSAGAGAGAPAPPAAAAPAPAPAPASAPSKEPEPEPEPEDHKEYTVDELLEQHKELLDSMLAEVMLVNMLGLGLGRSIWVSEVMKKFPRAMRWF